MSDRERSAIEIAAKESCYRAYVAGGSPSGFQTWWAFHRPGILAALQDSGGERWEVYDERRHGDQSGTVFLVIGPRVPTRPLGPFPEWLSAGEAARRFASGEDAPEGEPWPPSE